MASQLGSVRRDPRLRRDQNAELQARMQYLPQIMANKASKKVELKRDAQFAQQMGLEQDKFRLQKKRNKFQERQGEAMMGLEATKMGTNMAFGPMGNQNLGQMIGNTGSGMFGGGTAGGGGKTATKAGLIGGLNIGGMLSSGLTGFGVGRMMGGSKKKRAGVGALAGGLMGLMGGKSTSLGGAGLNFGKGALMGGLGGLF